MSVNYSEIARKTLVEQLGDTGEDIFSRVIARKPLSEKSSVGEVTDFIKTVEHIIIAVSGQEKANEIVLILRSMIQETAKQTVQKEKVENQNTELEDFLRKHVLPTEPDIIDFAKYLTMKYGGNAKKVEVEITAKARDHLKKTISKKRINEEIIGFLGKFTNPEKKDIDDFITFLKMSKIDAPEEEIREKIEKTRLVMKFHESQGSIDKSGEFDQLISNIKSCSDKASIVNLLQKQGLGYIIKDENGVSDKYLFDFIELLSPGEIEKK